MGEAIIARGETVDPKLIPRYSKVLKTEIITENTIWEVPGTCIVEEGISVRIFGGGGGGSYSYGGGGGYMNNAILNLNTRDRININIGDGGKVEKDGGTTTFGNYLSANGGSWHSAITKDNVFAWIGGCGGSGGGSSGIGYQFGGGGCSGGTYLPNGYKSSMSGGNGGKWGGGGGSFNGPISISTGGLGSGGICNHLYATNTIAQNGTTISNIIFEDLSSAETKGLGGGIGGGGGGYGGCGGNGKSDYNKYYTGSGWGYCYGGCGGGGGYGANGGNGALSSSSGNSGGGGGGGGYGGKGADATQKLPGGGGGYGSANYGCGGGNSCNKENSWYGMHGVCIIQYYAKELV